MAVDMALALRHDHDLLVWTLDEPGEWAGRLRDAEIPVRSLERRPGIDARVAIRLAAELRQSGASIVHAHQCTPWFYAALSRVPHSSPRLLLEEHGRFWPERDSVRRRLANRLFVVPLTHRFVAVSADIAGRLERYEGIPASRIEVIPNGIAPPEPIDPARRAALRAEFGFSGDDVVVGAIGRLDPIKNLPMFVRALAKARATDPRVRGLVVGDGPQRDSLAGLVRDLGLRDRIVLAGHRDDARALAACLDVFVLASYSEGISVALLEAMSAGVPSIVTNVGGNPDVVENGVNGWLVPSDDVGALADAIFAAAASPCDRAARGAAARRRFESHFTLDVMLRRYRSLYREMLGTPSAPPALDEVRG